LVEVLTNSSI